MTYELVILELIAIAIIVGVIVAKENTRTRFKDLEEENYELKKEVLDLKTRLNLLIKKNAEW